MRHPSKVRRLVLAAAHIRPDGCHPEVAAPEQDDPRLPTEQDFVRLDHAVDMLNLFPDCRLAVLPGTKHTEVMQRSEQLRAIVGPFLS